MKCIVHETVLDRDENQKQYLTFKKNKWWLHHQLSSSWLAIPTNYTTRTVGLKRTTNKKNTGCAVWSENTTFAMCEKIIGMTKIISISSTNVLHFKEVQFRQQGVITPGQRLDSYETSEEQDRKVKFCSQPNLHGDSPKRTVILLSPISTSRERGYFSHDMITLDEKEQAWFRENGGRR